MIEEDITDVVAEKVIAKLVPIIYNMFVSWGHYTAWLADMTENESYPMPTLEEATEGRVTVW